jgi:uncharacterized protein involved in exopolysaccharide biosynthesis
MAEDIKEKEDEISLIDLFAVLWKRRIMIIVITVIAAIGVTTFSVISITLPPEKSFYPNVYTSAALMLINNQSSEGGGLSAMLGSSGLGGLASLAGLSASTGSTSSGLAAFLVSTNGFFDAVVEEFDLMSKIDLTKSKSPRTDSRNLLKDRLKAEFDSESGVFSISFTDTDPVFAQRIINYAVVWLEQRFNELGVDQNKLEKENLEVNINSTYDEIMGLEQEMQELGQMVQRGAATIRSIPIETARIELELNAKRQIYTQLKVQYELLKVTMASESPVFQILERAEVPDQKSGPSRGMLCIIVTLAAGFFSVFLAFVLNAIENLRKDPEAMAKLRGKSREA